MGKENPQKEESTADVQWARGKVCASRWGVSESYLEKLRMLGEGPPFAKLGRGVLYNLERGDAWMRARCGW